MRLFCPPHPNPLPPKRGAGEQEMSITKPDTAGFFCSLAAAPLPPAILMIIGKISGSFPHHGFAALGTVHLEAGDAALMGDLGPADWTAAEIRGPRPLAGS